VIGTLATAAIALGLSTASDEVSPRITARWYRRYLPDKMLWMVTANLKIDGKSFARSQIIRHSDSHDFDDPPNHSFMVTPNDRAFLGEHIASPGRFTLEQAKPLSIYCALLVTHTDAMYAKYEPSQCFMEMIGEAPQWNATEPRRTRELHGKRGVHHALWLPPGHRLSVARIINPVETSFKTRGPAIISVPGWGLTDINFKSHIKGIKRARKVAEMLAAEFVDRDMRGSW